MDNTRYKSVAVPNETHNALRIMARRNGRTIGGQMSYIVRSFAEDQGYVSKYKEVRDSEKEMD